MLSNDRERLDDPPTPQLETQRLARDEYDPPRYGSAAGGDGQLPAGRGRALAHAYRDRDLDQLRVHELMSGPATSVHPALSIERAARLMEEGDCGALPVIGDNGVLVGMITDRDIAVRICARGRDARTALVADGMTGRVFACYANESVTECMRQMARHQVRRMPIVDDRGRLVGIVAQADLARHAGRDPLPEEPRALTELVSAVSQPADMPT